MQEELTRELGPGRAPGLGDQARLPYTDAILHEAQRLLALVPMGMPHTLTKTTCFRGYTLPQVGMRSLLPSGCPASAESVAVCVSLTFWILVSLSLSALHPPPLHSLSS